MKFIHSILKQSKLPICKNCGKEYIKYRTTDKACSIPCAIELGKKKVWEKEKKAIKEKSRTRTEWLNLLQVCTNELIRRIDYGHCCISCGGNGKPQSGHYHSTQANPTLRFHLFNIWLQDYRCNVELSANIIGYNKGLRETFGNDFQTYIEVDLVNEHKILKLTENDIKEAIKVIKEILRELPKDTKYTNEGRIQLRKIYQERIGLYK